MSTYVVGKDTQALVADIGSFSTKIGYAGDDHPQAVYNSTTAITRTNGSLRSSNFSQPPKRDFTTRCINNGNKDGTDGDYELVNPIDPVTGWLFSPPNKTTAAGGSSLSSNDAPNNSNNNLGDCWESHELVSHYLQHAFHNALGLNSNGSNSIDNSSHNHPLLLLDKPHTPPALRQRLLEILFETHNLPAVFFLRDAIASCYAVGRTTATVVDVGYSSTMVTPVYEGFVETRGVLRNNGCSAKMTDELVLSMMDGIVKKQGGRRRKERLKRMNQRKLMEKEQSANSNAGGADQQQQSDSNSPPKRSSAKRDASGHFIKESITMSQALGPVPDYLMPLYQVRRAPTYTPRSPQFHNWSRLTLAREMKEMGLGVAVGPTGYVSRLAPASAQSNAEGGENSINPAIANNMFLTSSKLPYTLPDGTQVDISTASRCDVVELFFGNDDYNINMREQAFDDTVTKLEEYENEIGELLAKKKDDDENDGKANNNDLMGIAGSDNAAEVGDPYSNTSYRGEKASRHAGIRRGGKKTYYSPNTISSKLYSACLPYVRTAPPTLNNGDGIDGSGGASGTGGDSASNVNSHVNDNYFHYLTSAPPAQMVCDAAFRCDRDQQASLLGNVVVCGGGSCITGAAGVGAVGVSAGADGGAGVVASALGDEHAFPDRLREEIEGIVHRHTPGWRVKVTSPNISERAICSWLGGSILGSLGSFQDMWISRKDYEEFGSAIVNRKCP